MNRLLWTAAFVVTVGAAQGADVTVVSAADYQPAVAPGSLATAFGAGFATGNYQASLDQNGQLPKSLGGVSLSVDGTAALLLYVSPTQINFVVPAAAKVGTDAIVVKPSSGAQINGTATVQQTAPAIFSDGTPEATGAILNAVTLQLGPFAVQTPEISGSDQRTRLAIYATGLGYSAASPDRVTTTIQATIVEDSGKSWPLAVEYSGPAPGFFGLDQVNVVLPPELDGGGLVSLTLTGGSQVSNTVSLIVRYALPPSVQALQPASVAPEATVTLTGSKLATRDQGAASHAGIILILPDGREFPASAASASPGTLQAWVPPIADDKLQFYHGPAKICVQNDAGRGCAAASFTVASAVTVSGPPGQKILDLANQSLQTAIAAITAVDPTMASKAQSDGTSRIQQLQTMIQAARDGHPQTLSFTNIDGSVHTMPVDLNMIQAMDSVLAAQPDVFTGSTPSPQLRGLEEGGCRTPGEAAMTEIHEKYEANEALAQQIEQVSYNVVIGAAIAGCLTAGGAATLESLGTLTLQACLAGAAVQAAEAKLLTEAITQPILLDLLLSRFEIEAGPNFLGAIDTTSVEVGVNQDKDFDINATFVANFKGTITDLITKNLVKDALKSLSSTLIPGPVADKVKEELGETILAPLIEEAAKAFTPNLPANATQQIVLGQSTLKQLPPDSDYATLTLACGSDQSKVHGVKSTDSTFTPLFLSADGSSFLQAVAGPLLTSVHATVDGVTSYIPLVDSWNYPVLTVRSDGSSASSTSNGVTPGRNFYYVSNKDLSQYGKLLHDSETCSACDDPKKIKWLFEGTLQQTYPVSNATATGTETYSITAGGGVITESDVIQETLLPPAPGTATTTVTSVYDIKTGVQTMTFNATESGTQPDGSPFQITTTGSGLHTYAIQISENSN